MGGRHERGRVEVGLEQELATRHDIGAAERTALRSQARAIDRADLERDPDAVTRANAVYLTMRVEAGLSASGAKPPDLMADLMAEIARSGPVISDQAHE
jgi:hypothetical protein